MTITRSLLQVEYLSVYYEDMKNDCMQGTLIEIKCKGFYNPIYKGKWYGFFVNTYDNESPNYKAIEKSDRNAFLDATNFTPSAISIDDFSVTPSDNTVNTPSEWTLQVNLNVPMEEECYIKVYVPLDFEFIFDKIDSSGIFTPRSRKSTLSTNDVIAKNGDASEPRQTIVFSGCYETGNLGL